MADSAFDIVCKIDLQEVKNAIQHAMKEIVNRFDFKGSGTDIKLVDDGAVIELTSSDEYKIQSAREVLETKLVKRVPASPDRPRCFTCITCACPSGGSM